MTTKAAKTEKGALSHVTSGKESLDYFAKVGTYRGRDPKEVMKDLDKAWKEDPLLAVSILFYARMVTRTTKGFFESTKVQKGQGIKDEFIKGLAYLEAKHPDILEKNLWLVPLVGSWKDLWYDSAASKYSHYVAPEKVYALVKRGIGDAYNRPLIAKYLPRIRSSKNVKNDRHKRMNTWAIGLCKHLGWSAQEYRKFKSDPTNNAHLWQKQMCGKYWKDIDFGKIPGKALFQMVNKKGKDKQTTLERNGLVEAYDKWLDTQPVAKFTGYVYELFKVVEASRFNRSGMSKIQKKTLDKQFEGLIELAKKDGREGLGGNVWCALDTSGSMSSSVADRLSAYDVCVSLGVYFSSLNEGAFKDHVVMFDAVSKILKLPATGFVDKCNTIIQASTAWGGTNFQSVVDEIVKVRKANPLIPISEYPETLLVVSDMQFDKVGNNKKTNYEAMMKKLSAVGLGNMKVIWWYVTGRGKDVPNNFDDEGVAMISGFDPAIVSTILGGETTKIDTTTGKVRALTPMENMLKALDQEVLNQLKVD